MRRTSTLCSLAALGWLAACDRADTSSLVSPAGSDLSSSTMAGLAFAQAGSLDSANDVLEGIDLSAPSASGPSTATVASLPAAARFAGRAAGSGVEILAGLTDTAKGWIVIASTKAIVGGSETDTAKLGWKAGAVDTTRIYWLKGSKSYLGGASEQFSLKPVTPDGLLSQGRAWMESRSVLASGIASHVKMLADAGPDGSFSTEADNRIWSLSWERLNGADTLARAQIANVDTALPLTGATSFRASAWEGRTALHPLQKNRTWEVVGKVQGNDTVMTSLVATRLGIYGRIDSVTTRNVNGTAFAGKGDTALIRHFVQYAGQTNSDTLLSEEATLKVRLATGLGKAGNFLQGIDARRDHRLGTVATTTFSWKAVTEVSDGAQPSDGSILLVATLRDGRKATLAGTFGNGVIDATWTAPDGTVTTVHQARK